MSKVILFGRSPFISKIDVEKIIENNPTTIGLNYFCQSYEVGYNFCWKEFIMPKSLDTSVFYHYEEQYYPLGIKYKPQASKVPFLEMKIEDGIPIIARANFIASTALNWAIMLGYKEVYLVGIDHKEEDKKFEHFDKINDKHGQNMTPEMHREFKNYVYECAKHIKIYQTNPEVKDDWDLPFVDIGALYGQS